MNKIITKSVKVALTAGALAVALTGCCMFGPKDCCCAKERCKSECDGMKKHPAKVCDLGMDFVRFVQLAQK